MRAVPEICDGPKEETSKKWKDFRPCGALGVHVFLDPKQYQMNPKSDAGHRNVGTIHKTYLRMQDTKVGPDE
eukprot:g12693.t1